jgi:uncharacterized membrane protein
VLASFNPILYKRMLEDADAVVAVWGVSLLGLPLLGLFTVALTPQFPALDWVFVIGVLGSAGLNVAAHLASTQALKLEDASLVTPLLVFSPVFTVLVAAFFLGELPTARGVLGVGLVLAGAYWLHRGAEGGWLGPIEALALKPGVVLVLLAGGLWAVTPLFEKVAIRHTFPESPRFVAFSAAALLTLFLTPAVAARGKAAIGKLRQHGREWFFAALIAGTAPVLGYTAYSLGLVGYVTTLFKLSTVMTVLWSALFLKEGGLMQRLPASAVMVIGAILIAV